MRASRSSRAAAAPRPAPLGRGLGLLDQPQGLSLGGLRPPLGRFGADATGRRQPSNRANASSGSRRLRRDPAMPRLALICSWSARVPCGAAGVNVAD